MLARFGIVCVALLVATPLARAQDAEVHQPSADVRHEAALNGGPARETLEADATRVALRRTFQPQAQPSRAELMSILMLMSLHERRTQPSQIRE